MLFIYTLQYFIKWSTLNSHLQLRASLRIFICFLLSCIFIVHIYLLSFEWSQSFRFCWLKYNKITKMKPQHSKNYMQPLVLFSIWATVFEPIHSFSLLNNSGVEQILVSMIFLFNVLCSCKNGFFFRPAISKATSSRSNELF